ncbi:FAD-binding monooxygenase [Kribbella sancticallisti]|uniref:FAD-binding monooxygenase n=1 Tax=Kribbella sancticallisti TaxID=460087 RepID=A0ABP4PFQ2_9ACTN
MTPTHRDRAVVLGGSIAGLLAARVLADNFAEVLIIDRDPLGPEGAPRRGTPQARHLHGLLARGHRVLEELFPGLTAELVARGAPVGDMLANTRLCFGGHRFRQGPSGLTALCVSRPTLESAVRRRVVALSGVQVLGRRDVVGLTASRDNRRVVGARVIGRTDGSAEEQLPADLVVDATGRGSRLPIWLQSLGYLPPEQERVSVGVGYASRQYRLPPEALGNDLVAISAPTPARPRGGGLSLIEGGRCLVTLMGVLGDHPPIGAEGFARFAADLVLPDVHEILEDAEPLDEPVAYRYPLSVRNRYDRLTRFPDGLAVVGDAVCTLNPIYGQGMTIAALEAAALHRHLAKGRPLRPREYLRDVGRISGVAWALALGADLSFPEVKGTRTPASRLLGLHVRRLQSGAEHDARLGRAFLRVTSLMDPPPALFRPSVVIRSMTAHDSRGSQPAG